MSELTYIMKARAEAWGASLGAVTPEEATAIAREATRARRRRSALVGAAGFAVVAGLGGAAWLVLGGAQDPMPPATTSPSPSSSPSASAPSATPSATPAVAPAIIDGFAPVPQLPASEIPWDQVGPGWFAIDYSDPFDADTVGLEWGSTPQLDGGISLLSLDGKWYAAMSHADLGNGPLEGWDGTNFWVAREVRSNVESVEKRLDVVNAQTLAASGVAGEAQGQVVPFDDGRALYYAWGGDGLINSVVAVDKTDQMGGCSDVGSGFWGWEAQDMSFLYNPVNAGSIVCFGPAETEGSTFVTYVTTASLEGSMGINEFVHDPMSYSFIGWVDDNQFLFARTTDGAPITFRYDVRDDSVTEVGMPQYYGVDGLANEGFFDRVSQRHVITQRVQRGWTVDLYEVDGTPVAALSGECAPWGDGDQSWDVRTSGGRLVVTCQDPGYVEMYDLSDGSLIGQSQVGTERRIVVFDAPDS